MIKRIIFGLAGATTATALFFALVRYDPRWFGFDWTSMAHVPVQVLDDLEIGEAGGLLKRGSLRLLCSPEGVRIKMQKRIPAYWEEWRQKGPPAFNEQPTHVFFDHTVSSNGVQFRKFETVSSFARWTPFDILVSQPLTSDQKRAFVDWFERDSPQDVSIHVIETASRFLGRGSASDVSGFIARCDQVLARSSRVAVSTSP